MIRPATEQDWPAIWPVFREVVEAGDTYAYPPPEVTASRSMWFDGSHVVVAERDGVLLGTAKAGPNRPGRGAHVATASFMVASAARGQGVGRALGEHVLAWARGQGFRSMQFNAVVETNPAVHLWRSLGFEVVGTVPEAFDSATHGLVGLHVMHRSL